jgi:hypothetical protein
MTISKSRSHGRTVASAKLPRWPSAGCTACRRTVLVDEGDFSAPRKGGYDSPMTMRTRTNYVCTLCDHKGHTVLSENDQPYSRHWERTAVHDMDEHARMPPDPSKSGTIFVCPPCQVEMTIA